MADLTELNEIIEEVRETLADVKEIMVEVLEKVNNLTLDNSGYDIEE